MAQLSVNGESRVGWSSTAFYKDLPKTSTSSNLTNHFMIPGARGSLASFRLTGNLFVGYEDSG